MRSYRLKKCKRVHDIHFTSDGTRLLAVGGDEVRMVDYAVWLDLATGETVGRIDQFAQCYAVPADLSRFVLGDALQGRGWVGIASVQWTPLSGPVEWRKFPSKTQAAPPNFRDVVGLAFDPTGTRLAISHSRRAGVRSNPNRTACAVTVVDRDTGETVADVGTGDEPATVMAFSVDGTQLAVTGGVDGNPDTQCYSLATGELRHSLGWPGTVTRCVRFLPENRFLVANGRCVYVWSLERGEELFTLSGHPKQVNAVALTPDGRRLLTASHDGSIRTWDANTGEPGGAFDWNIGAVTALAFAPDGLTCAAAGLNGKIVVWDVDG